MAYAIMLSPTDDRFICQEPCEHTDCASLKKFITNAKCNTCTLPIIPGDAYYNVGEPKEEKIECFNCSNKIPVIKSEIKVPELSTGKTHMAYTVPKSPVVIDFDGGNCKCGKESQFGSVYCSAECEKKNIRGEI